MKKWFLGIGCLLILTGCDRLRVGDARVKAEIMDTEAERNQGLSGREELGKNEGMLFVFESAGRHKFWMKGMKFPLDFIWIKGDKVVEVTENVGVEVMNLQPQEPVDKVLEVNSGWARKNRIKVGDNIKL